MEAVFFIMQWTGRIVKEILNFCRKWKDFGISVNSCDTGTAKPPKQLGTNKETKTDKISLKGLKPASVTEV
jgi:hypothetical protein